MADGERGSFGYGLIGCGDFGLFCLEQYRGMEGLACRAASDVDADAARRAAQRFGIDACSPDELLRRNDIDIVHVATPPFSHRDLSVRALEAGKHVLCEKPLATTLEDARAIVAAARRAGRLLAVNLIMRYDPLCVVVKQLVERRLLGEPLHGFFENYAKDEPLVPSHWFWDPARSGGIFIEHAVHFFDLFDWWLGQGRVVAAQALKRPGTGLVEHVNCTTLHGDQVIVNFYHGFHQATRMDRQETRVVFERGSVSLDDWVPTRLRLDAIVDEGTLEALCEMMPGAHVRRTGAYAGEERRITSRHRSYTVDRRVEITYDLGMEKPALYAHVLRELMADQLAAMRNPDHRRRITEAEGVTSLETALRADRLSRHREG